MIKSACRCCDFEPTVHVLSLGAIPLANALLSKTDLDLPEERYPLNLMYCPRCSLVQIAETLPPEKLFRNYLYLSSFSDTVLNNAREIVYNMIDYLKLNKHSMVIEIASNDGYLLQNYKERGIPVLGVEPAQNIAQVAERRGIPTICEFFDESLAKRMLHGGQSADVIHAHNVIAHVANLHSVMAGIATLLKPDGVGIIENHYIKDLIEQVQFDAIYHEHLCYFSVTSFAHLFGRHNLVLADAEHIPIHGGSLRVYVQRADGPRSFRRSGRENVERLLASEIQAGLHKGPFYAHFGKRISHLRHELVSLLGSLKSEGKRIVGYGASAKSTTLLNYFGIGSETLDFVVDRSTVKQNYYTPGTRLPILSPDKLLELQPDYSVLLAWNLANEILVQQAEYRRRGGKFIIPIPELKIV